MANFLRNVPSRFGALYPQSDTRRGMRETLIGGYFQDDLRLTNTLTLNLGFRYEMMTIPTEVDGKVALLKNLTDPTVTVGGKIHDSNPTLKNFAPRIGVAWDPFGTRTTAIRAGFGVFDVLPFLYLYETPLNRSTPLFLQGNALNPPTGSFPGRVCAARRAEPAHGVGRSQSAARVSQAVERQYPASDRRLEHGDRLRRRARHEPAARRAQHEYGHPGQGRRPVGVSLARHEHRAESEFLVNQHDGDVEFGLVYHGLQAVLKRNLRNGLQTQASYTWSKSIDTGSSISSVSSGTGYESSFAVATPLLPELGRGPSNYDVPQNFVGSVVWEIPSRCSSLNGFTSGADQGWQISGVYRAQSGYPFTLALNGDRAGSKADTTASPLGQPPDLLIAAAKRRQSGLSEYYIRTECFAFPADGVLGNLGRNALQSPGLADARSRPHQEPEVRGRPRRSSASRCSTRSIAPTSRRPRRPSSTTAAM